MEFEQQERKYSLRHTVRIADAVPVGTFGRGTLLLSFDLSEIILPGFELSLESFDFAGS